MDFDFTPEEQAFRVTVQGFLADNLQDPANEYDPDFLAEWDRKIAAQGWLGFAWPRDAGGAGASLIEQFILKEEMSTICDTYQINESDLMRRAISQFVQNINANPQDNGKLMFV